MKPNFVLAMTGASGAIYGVRLLERLLAAGCDVQLVISPAGAAVIEQELQVTADVDQFEVEEFLRQLSQQKSPLWQAVFPLGWALPTANELQGVRHHHYRDLLAPIASG